jgi:hypothetical protein
MVSINGYMSDGSPMPVDALKAIGKSIAPSADLDSLESVPGGGGVMPVPAPAIAPDSVGGAGR